ncbi:ABC-type sugar transport system (probably encoding FT maltose/maltodextrin transporter subunit, also similar to UgpE), permease component II [Candidatus Phytoplasma mali]|uniref:ABC-type sugar transport system (Probably encoding FT maltose/maltodextrin transporter subunit, also similar to UgpE), permease component II n=1 Tax=Phytoplasma mali (strain AT) TaxID=482235 RepID=B3R0I4_PHYMT|nr:carbohydrate ABC transporter permease [Candidatus Phytoplasma mali]CAP18348.1 ABC-type sugar transport system (probably encoding FT maltose/maltodextrin transporter subunit, also similar to UgpE), permease component II [Candidatus Phytoplasma mali]
MYCYTRALLYFKNIFNFCLQKIKKIKIIEIFICIFKYIFLVLCAIFLVFPFVFMIICTLKSDQDILSSNFSFPPKEITFKNFYRVLDFKEINLFEYFLNTVKMVFFSTLLGTFISIITAFCFSILKFKSKKTLYTLLFLGMIINNESLLLTNFRTVTSLKMTDTGDGSTIIGGVYLAMILPFLVDIFHIFLLIENSKKVPRELYYASKIDGTNDWNYLWKIWVPILKPTIVTTIIFRSIAAWNSYMWPELVGGKLLTNKVRRFFYHEAENLTMNLQMTISFLVILPLILIFLFFKKYIITGELQSGIKG